MLYLPNLIYLCTNSNRYVNHDSEENNLYSSIKGRFTLHIVNIFFFFSDLSAFSKQPDAVYLHKLMDV